MLQENLHQLSSQRAACKLWSAFIAVAILLAGAFGRLDTPSLLWVSAPIVVLGLAEAGYAARERSFLEQASREQAGGQQLQPESVGLADFLSALRAFSVWPFYLVLWGIFVASAINLPRNLPNNQAATVVPAPPSIPGAPNLGSGTNLLPGVPQRSQSAPANLPVTYPAYPGIPLHTPTMGNPRPTPVNFGPRPLVRPPITPPSPVPMAGSTPPAAGPAR